MAYHANILLILVMPLSPMTLPVSAADIPASARESDVKATSEFNNLVRILFSVIFV